MTKEQEEAIEYLKKHIKYFEEQIKFIEATDCDYYDEELELYRNRVKQFNIVLSMLKEKDKIIDEMAKTINEAYYASGDFEEWFENKICKIQRYEDYTYLEKNIKQYFERKVEG